MNHYVCGFAFDTSAKVVLISKRRPEWQVGKLNGVGGKVAREDILNTTGQVTGIQCAMSREFEEEAGVAIPPERWKQYHKETWENRNTVSFLTTGLYPGEWPSTQTDETIALYNWRNDDFLGWLNDSNKMYNLAYLVPMAYVFLYVKPELLPYHRAP